MKALLLTLLAVAVLAAAASPPWVVLIETVDADEYGSPQTEGTLCFQYHTLLKRGVPADHIITMTYNAGPHSKENPWKGRLYVEPQGADQLPGCVMDYTSSQVTVSNFEKVVLGDASAPGRVVKATADDEVLIIFQNHGDVGLVGFPNGAVYHVSQLQKLLTKRATSVKNVAMYIMACFSGSMFKWLKPTDNTKIYGMTSSNGSVESGSSWCGRFTFDNKTSKSDNCLAPTFTAAWDGVLETSPRGSMHDQFALIKEWMKQPHNETEGYTTIPVEFGDPAIKAEPLANFEGGARQRKNSNVKMPEVEGSLVEETDPALECALRSYLFLPALRELGKDEAGLRAAHELRASVDAALRGDRAPGHTTCDEAALSRPIFSVPRSQLSVFVETRRVQRALADGRVEEAQTAAGKLRQLLSQREAVLRFAAKVGQAVLRPHDAVHHLELVNDMHVVEVENTCRLALLEKFKHICHASIDQFAISRSRATLATVCDGRHGDVSKLSAIAARVAHAHC